MRFYNCCLEELNDRVGRQKLVMFGVGEYFELYVKEVVSKELLSKVEYFVDNSKAGMQVQLLEKSVPIYSVSKLKEEKKCVVILCSGNYMYEMYEQLVEMNLNDGISCYSLPLTLVDSIGKQDAKIKEEIFKNKGTESIKKVIHSFWFSGDKKPDAYQKCVDSWKRVCPDYEIQEWNMNNYDYTKNKFMRQAIETKKWAFASDFARLDVVYNQGGIYLDMDVELIKSLDYLLNNEAFFTFDTHNDIDLGTFAARAGNPLVKAFMELYDNVEFSGTAKTMNWFCQPRYIRNVLKEFGLELNGNLQVIGGNVFLPRNYLAPKDSIIYELSAMTDDTVAIHHYNAGWRDGDYRVKRIRNNKILWDMVKKIEMK